MNPFQQLLNTARRTYRAADKRSGGWLPGGGVPNPLSNAVNRTFKVINPQDALGYAVATTAAPVQQALQNSLRKTIDSSTWGRNLKELPRLMNAANVELNRLGVPGTWSTEFPKTLPPGFGAGALPQGVQVDTQRGGLYQLMGPHFEFNEKAIRVGPQTPGWIAAHEFGHAIDFFKNPGAFNYAKDIYNKPEKLERWGRNTVIQQSSPGAIVTGLGGIKNEDDSLLSAGIEGALSGLGASQNTLRAEIQADRYGMPLARAAGIKWDHPANLVAKGTYLAGAAYPGFMQGVTSELLGRGVNAFTGLTGAAMRALQGNKLSPMEQSLTQYGYNPVDYSLTTRNNQIQINKRNEMEKSLYNFVSDPNRKITPGY